MSGNDPSKSGEADHGPVPGDPLAEGTGSEDRPGGPGPRPDAPALAFEGGRQRARLGFYVSQAPFFPGPRSPDDHRTYDGEAQEAGRLLAAAVARLAAAGAQGRVRDGILDAVDYARGSYLNENFPDEARQAREDLSVLPRDKVIHDFLFDIHDALGRIDELIDRLVGGEDRTRAAFDLGRRLEELLCPDRIERRIYDPNWGDDPGRLANVWWWPGDATIEPGQIEELKGLAADAGLPTAVVERFDGLRDLAPAAIVEWLAGVIGPALANPAPTGPSPRLKVDLQQPVVFVDDKPYPVSEAGAEVVRGLLEAKGQPRSRSDLRAERPKLKDVCHIERVLDGLPPAVLAAIFRRRGKPYRIKDGYLG
jgi:hypothetical protein